MLRSNKLKSYSLIQCIYTCIWRFVSGLIIQTKSLIHNTCKSLWESKTLSLASPLDIEATYLNSLSVLLSSINNNLCSFQVFSMLIFSGTGRDFKRGSEKLKKYFMSLILVKNSAWIHYVVASSRITPLRCLFSSNLSKLGGPSALKLGGTWSSMLPSLAPLLILWNCLISASHKMMCMIFHQHFQFLIMFNNDCKQQGYRTAKKTISSSSRGWQL